jgi:uncharacterized phage-associated protein
MAQTIAAAVANEFLAIQAADASQFPRIDQMKIQKLVFYSHAWWLALNDEALFDDDIEAWPWGPVTRDVYSAFRSCGRSPISTERAYALVKTGAGPLDYTFSLPPTPPQDVQTFLRSVWDSHKSMTGIQLSNATHLPGEPWTIVKDQYGSLDSKPVIPNALIRDVFKAKLGKTTPNTPATAAVQ